MLAEVPLADRGDTEEAAGAAERLRMALEAAGMGTWEWDIPTNRVSWSEGVESIFGLPPGGFAGTYEAYLALILPDDLPGLLAAVQGCLGGETSTYSVEHRIRWPDGSLHWLSGRGNVRRGDDGRPVRMSGTVTDITARKDVEEALRRANRALRAMAACNETIARASGEEEMLRDLCAAVVRHGGGALAFVGLADAGEGLPVRIVAHAGPGAYLEGLRLSWADVPNGRGPTGRAIREGAPVVCRDFRADPAMAPWRERALAHGFASSVALPLRLRAQVIGALGVYAREPGAYGEEEVRLLQELADNVAFGIEAQRMRARHQRADRELRENNAKLQLAMEVGKLGWWEFDVRSRVFTFDESLVRILDPLGTLPRPLVLPAEEYAHRFLPAEEAGMVAAEIAAALASAGPAIARHVEHRLLRTDGSVGHVMVRYAVERPPGGPPRTFGVIQDITARKSAELALEQQRRRANAVIESAMDGILTLDDELKVVVCNPAAERIFRCSAADVLGRTIDRFLPPEARVLHDRHVRAFAASGASSLPMGRQVEGVRADGEHFPLEASVSQVEVDGRRLFTITLRDVSDRARAEAALRASEERLRQAQKMEAVGQLAGGIAHDFNNLIAAILMNAELAAGEPGLPEDLRDELAAIAATAQRAANLTRQLLQFSRRELLQPRNLDLNQVATNAASLLRRLLREDVVLDLSLAPAPLFTHADPTMLDQVLMNLAVNARDAMPRGGRLTLATAARTLGEEEARAFPDAAPGAYVCLQVRDTGEGIPAEHLPHLFEPFFTTKAVGQGTGLGLATVFGIVRQHRGVVAVKSERGKGTCFEVLLPALPGTARAPTDPELQPPARPGHETILVVEDDPAVRQAMHQALAGQGYQVTVARDGPEALAAWRARAGAIDLVITDLVMPGGLDGRELSARLRAERPGLPVLLTSGYSPDFFGGERPLAPGERFAAKPLPLRDLFRLVRQALDGGAEDGTDAGD